MALLDAMLALELGSERACSIAVAAWEVGVQLQAGAGRIGWALEPTRHGANAATLIGRATTLRKKQRRIRHLEEANWRWEMGSAFMLVLGANRDQNEAVKAAIIQRAGKVGEASFAQSVLWPMLGAKYPRPDFLINFGSTSEIV